MSDSSVKVGVRIRPLVSLEKDQECSLTKYDSQSINFKNQAYTFDYVFGPQLSQQQLYEDTAAPMLKSFLEGYNVTIIAYGQTGSGKTFTMGTSDANMDDVKNQGLIPRFIYDLFENLKQSHEEQKLQSKVKVSFLEIYGEDIYDLLSTSIRGMDRPSLPIRENDQGLIYVQGQQEMVVTSPEEALSYLYNGSQTNTTLVYARQARNIQNKPVKNMDPTQLELRKLKIATREWMLQAVSLAFPHYNQHQHHHQSSLGGVGFNGGVGVGVVYSRLEGGSSGSSNGGSGGEDILRREECISDRVVGDVPTPRKIRLSIVPSPFSGTKKRPHINGANSSKYTAHAHSPRSLRLSASDMPLARDLDALDWQSIALDMQGVHTEDIEAQSMFPESQSGDVEESERLVSRMLEIVAKEKEMFGQDMDSDDEEEIKAVEQDILEKEEILSKLMDTVKSFAPMKQEYERLLTAIGKLDTERKYLEQELEIAKKQAENSSNVDRINEKLQKAKGDLDKMRQDRVQKESAFKVMQRGTQQADSLQRQLKKLKEERINIIKQQKTQSQEFQKIQKENTQKVCQLKKSDVKKQQLLNTLKYEVERKERLLALKSKEIGRMATKLKVSEKHIKSLINNQIKGRNKLVSSGSGKNEADKDGKNRYGLSADDFRRFEVNKSMLDVLINDRVEEKYSRNLYTIKMQQYEKLNEELSVEVSELEQLHARRASVTISTATTTAKGSGGGEGPVDEYDNNEQPLSYEMEEILQSIAAIESNIEGISRDMDIVKGDLDDISDRLQRQSDGNSNGNENEWESTCMDLISGLELSLSRPLLWHHILEKIEIMDALKLSELEMTKCRSTIDNQESKTRELEQRIENMKRDFDDRIFEAEKQRIQDVWAVLKGKDCASTSTSTSDGSEGRDPSRDIPIKRAQDLESELLEYVMNEARLNTELTEHKTQIGKLERRLYSLDIRAKLDALSKGQSSSSVDSSSSSGGTQSESSSNVFLQELEVFWDKLGSSKDDRLEVVKKMEMATKNAKEEVLTQIKQFTNSTEDTVKVLEENFKVNIQALGANEEDYIPGTSAVVAAVHNGNSNKHTNNNISGSLPLLEYQTILQNALQSTNKDLSERYGKFTAIKDRLIDLVSEMGMDVSDLPTGLQSVMAVALSSSNTTGQSGIDQFAKALTAAGTSLRSEDLERFGVEMRQLNASRTITISRAAPVKTEVTQLVELLAIRDEEALLEIGCPEPSEPSLAMKKAVRLAFTSTSSTPPGNDAVLSALEHLRFGLKSVLVNRESASNLCIEFLTHLNTCLGIQQNQSELTDPIAPLHDAMQLEKLLRLMLQSTSRCKLVANSCISKLTVLIPETAIWSLHNKNTNNNTTGNVNVNDDISNAMKVIANILNTTATIENGPEGRLQSAAEMRLSVIISELDDLCTFSEERWLSRDIRDIVSGWNSTTGGKKSVHEAILLQEELNRLMGQQETVTDLRQLDVTLEKHISDMEAFETTSRNERDRVLKGSSKALIEEEKFRKNGKRKYEQLSEKLVTTYRHLRQYTHGENVDISALGLSRKAQDLLRGLGTERIELMHLHTITHGTRRWSNEDANSHNTTTSSIDNSDNTSSSGHSHTLSDGSLSLTTTSNIITPANKVTHGTTTTSSTTSKGTNTSTKSVPERARTPPPKTSLLHPQQQSGVGAGPSREKITTKPMSLSSSATRVKTTTNNTTTNTKDNTLSSSSSSTGLGSALRTLNSSYVSSSMSSTSVAVAVAINPFTNALKNTPVSNKALSSSSVVSIVSNPLSTCPDNSNIQQQYSNVKTTSRKTVVAEDNKDNENIDFHQIMTMK
eukprot:gene7618-15601_t